MSDANNHLRPSTNASMADSDKTATQSHAPSIVDKPGVPQTVAPSTEAAVLATDPMAAGEKHAVDANTLRRDSQVSVSDEEDGFVYPKGLKLAAITTALCLSVFCMALVCHLRCCLHIAAMRQPLRTHADRF
jgi:hypothetical protein